MWQYINVIFASFLLSGTLYAFPSNNFSSSTQRGPEASFFCDFQAPRVSDRFNYDNDDDDDDGGVGSIVFDTSDGSFYGMNGLGEWLKLNNEPAGPPPPPPPPPTDPTAPYRPTVRMTGAFLVNFGGTECRFEESTDPWLEPDPEEGGNGYCTYRFRPGIFAGRPSCTVSPVIDTGSNRRAAIGIISVDEVQVITGVNNPSQDSNERAQIICVGKVPEETRRR